MKPAIAVPGSHAPPSPRRYVGEARATTNRVARTFSLACRLLPRACREDVYLLYLVFRTLDDLVDERRPEAAERVEAVAAWADGRPGRADARDRGAGGARRRTPLPRAAFAAFCAGMRTDLAGAALRARRPTWTATATGSPGRSAR